MYQGDGSSVGSTGVGCQTGNSQKKLTVSYTGCGSFSLRHHSSRHILGVIWGGYALLGKGGETVRAYLTFLPYVLARATKQPLVDARGTGETEISVCAYSLLVPPAGAS
jgi:hypothetical protein